MNMLADSIVVLWFLPVVFFILFPLGVLACSLIMQAVTGLFGRSGEIDVPVTKEVGAGL